MSSFCSYTRNLQSFVAGCRISYFMSSSQIYKKLELFRGGYIFFVKVPTNSPYWPLSITAMQTFAQMQTYHLCRLLQELSNLLNDEFHVAETLLRRRQSLNYPRISQNFMESEGSLPCSQNPSTGPYPEADHSSAYHPIQAKIHLNIILQPTSRSS
jgi:hypothetical protein